MLSLRETARRHDIDPGYLSTRVRARKPAKGYDLYQYARFSEEGQIEGFVFPSGYVFPDEETQSREDSTSKGALHGEGEGRATPDETGPDEAGGEEAGSSPPATSSGPSGSRDKDSLSFRPTADHGLGGNASIRKYTRPDATADEFFEAANELDMPARSDWITEDEVRSLMVQHLPLTRREWKVLIRPVLELLSKETVGDRYRRRRIESMVRLIGEHGTERAMDLVTTACDLDRERIKRLRRIYEPHYNPNEILRVED
jgi:hypothetical protein